jgi:hypothetical protein
MAVVAQAGVLLGMQALIPVETHGPLFGAAALWLVMLSPLSALLIELLGAWLVRQCHEIENKQS